MKTNKLFIAILVALFSGCAVNSTVTENSQNISLSDYVNPFIGASTNTGKAGVAHGLGKTFPGADTPFGLVQVSPNTITGYGLFSCSVQ